MKSILLVIPHNPVWIGSSENIVHHPAFYRKLSIFANFFNYVIVLRGSSKNETSEKIKLIHDNKSYVIIDFPMKYSNILMYTLMFIVNFTNLVLHFKTFKSMKLFLLCFNHVHFYSLYAKMLSKIMNLKVISFYVTTPTNFKENILYLISKILDSLSIVNHPIIALKLKLRKPVVIPNVPGRSFFCKINPKSRDRKTLLFVGRLSKEKKPSMAIFIIAKLRRKIPDVRLLVIGNGPLRPYLEKIAEAFNIYDKNVFLLGHKSLNEVLKYMKSAGFLICTSLNEYFPNVLIEAMACGLPVIAPKLPQYSWIVGNDVFRYAKTDEVVEYIANLILDEHLYSEHVKRQSERLKHILLLYNNQLRALKRNIAKLTD